MSIRTGQWSNEKALPSLWTAVCSCHSPEEVMALGCTTGSRTVEAVVLCFGQCFASEALGPGIYVDVTLTHHVPKQRCRTSTPLYGHGVL